MKSTPLLLLLSLQLLLRVSSAVAVVAVEHRQQHQEGNGNARGGGGGVALSPGLRSQHRVRICNAYPSAASVEVFAGKKAKKLTSAPMSYRTCQELRMHLQAGDMLEFRLGGASAGFFTISDLPGSDSLLFLAIYRHDGLSSAASFASHVFANLLNAQVAVLDTFRGGGGAGASDARPEIRDVAANRSELLRFNSVVALNEGDYDVGLIGPGGAAVSTAKLVALNRESYVVLRTGVAAEGGGGDSFPQELVVFPNSHHSAGGRAGPPQLLALLIAALGVVAAFS